MAKKKTTNKALAPKTKPTDVEQTASKGMILPMRQAGVVVNEDTAMTLGAVFACVRVISESLAGLPWHPYRRRADGGLDRLTDHHTDWLLDVQANEETAAFQWRETMVAHALTWGNGFAEIERDLLGRPVNMWLLTPDRVEVVRFNGRIIYDVANHSAPNTVLEKDDVYHLKGLGFDGLVGYPVVRLAARAIGAGISTEEATSNFFQNDSTPGGILTAPGRLSDQARNNVVSSWEKVHGGPKNRRKVAVLEEGLKWEQTGLPPEDAQLFEQRQFTPTEICRWFRVPPHKIADLTRSTNNNIEHQSIEFVNDCLRPWSERLESEADIKLYGRNNRGSIITVIDLNELKRGDLASQTEHIQQLSDRGVYSINEARTYLGLNPISDADGGNKRFVQMNMSLLEKAGEEPPPAAAPPKPSADLSAACLPIIQDACERIAKREKDARRLEGDQLGEWIAKHKDYCRKVLLPCAKVLASVYCHKADIAALAAVNAYIERHAIGDGEASASERAITFKDIIIAASAAVGAA